MNPAFLALGAANPGLMPLAFMPNPYGGGYGGYGGSYADDGWQGLASRAVYKSVDYDGFKSFLYYVLSCALFFLAVFLIIAAPVFLLWVAAMIAASTWGSILIVSGSIPLWIGIWWLFLK